MVGVSSYYCILLAIAILIPTLRAGTLHKHGNDLWLEMIWYFVFLSDRFLNKYG